MHKHYIVYSHGFGVRKDGRGFLKDIAESMPEFENILFDYNEINEAENTLRVTPIDQQKNKLLEVIENIKKDDPDAAIDIIAHSQGCTIAALAKPESVRKIILIAPPDNTSAQKVMARYVTNKDSEINLQGDSKLKRRDGSTTIVSAAYLQSLQGLDNETLFNELPDVAEVIMIKANQDDVVGETTFNNLDSRIKVITIDGDHNFKLESRQKVIEVLQKELI